MAGEWTPLTQRSLRAYRLFCKTGRACMGTVFRSDSHWLGTYLILHFLPPYSPAPFFQTLVIDSENKKAALLVTGEQLKIRGWMPAPFLKIKKAGILMASRHKNPGRFKMITFWKLYKKAALFFQIFPEIINGAAQSLTAYGWYSSKDASQHVCIYETEKNRVHILY